MEARRIDLAEWEYFGEGGSSTSYINKLDGNIILKLNRKDIPAAVTEKEYLASKSFNEAGFPSPAIHDFVTDGERFGYTAQRIKGKISYAREMSFEPGSIGKLAGKFAELARQLHGTAADTSRMADARECLLAAMGDLSYVPADVAGTVRKCFSTIEAGTSCLHGDLNPGNLITFEGRDSWIGVNEFAYGDPYLDIATMHIICNYLPGKTVARLYHADVKSMKEFFTSFKKAYFGENWNSEEVNSRIEDAAMVKFCAAAATKPGYLRLLVPLARGQKLKFLFAKSTVSI